MNNSKLYCKFVCDKIEKACDDIREKYYSKNKFNKLIYGALLKKIEKDYSKSILELEKLVKMEYNI